MSPVSILHREQMSTMFHNYSHEMNISHLWSSLKHSKMPGQANEDICFKVLRSTQESFYLLFTFRHAIFCQVIVTVLQGLEDICCGLIHFDDHPFGISIFCLP